jgi:hypothetical protein
MQINIPEDLGAMKKYEVEKLKMFGGLRSRIGESTHIFSGRSEWEKWVLFGNPQNRSWFSLRQSQWKCSPTLFFLFSIVVI